MKILWIQDVFWPHMRGGGGTKAYYLILALAQRGHAVEVLARRTIPVGPEHRTLFGVPIHRIQTPEINKCFWRIKPWLMMHQWPEVIRRFLRNKSYDGAIVGGTNIAYHLRRLRPRLPIVVVTGGTWRGSKRYDFDRPNDGFSLRIAGQMIFWQYYCYERLSYQSADYIVAESMNVKEQLVRLYNVSTGRVPVIGNGVDHTLFRPRIGVRKHVRLRENWPLSAFLVISVGRLSSVKNFPYLIRAISMVKPGANIHAVIVGEGEIKADLQALAESLGVADRVHLLGYRSDVPDLLAAADVFILPSVYEAYGNAWLEALASGLPSMGLRREFGRVDSAADEHIRHGETGFLLAPDDPGDLARRLLQLVDSPELRSRMARAARQWALTHYSWDETARQYVGLLRRK